MDSSLLLTSPDEEVESSLVSEPIVLSERHTAAVANDDEPGITTRALNRRTNSLVEPSNIPQCGEFKEARKHFEKLFGKYNSQFHVITMHEAFKGTARMTLTLQLRNYAKEMGDKTLEEKCARPETLFLSDVEGYFNSLDTASRVQLSEKGNISVITASLKSLTIPAENDATLEPHQTDILSRTMVYTTGICKCLEDHGCGSVSNSSFIFDQLQFPLIVQGILSGIRSTNLNELPSLPCAKIA